MSSSDLEQVNLTLTAPDFRDVQQWVHTAGEPVPPPPTSVRSLVASVANTLVVPPHPQMADIDADADKTDVGDETAGAGADARASATFTQAYSSDNYRDEVRKTLDLVIEQGRWKIVREYSR